MHAAMRTLAIVFLVLSLPTLALADFTGPASVRRAGDQVRINAQLIDAQTGGHLWAERYDGSISDVFGLQDRITGSIVTSLAVRLTTDEEQ